MSEIIYFPDDTTQHAYLTTDNANDDLQVAVLDGDFVLLDTDENPVLRWDASEEEIQFLSATVVETRADDPSSPSDGRVWYRTDNDEYRGVENGSVVVFDTSAPP